MREAEVLIEHETVGQACVVRLRGAVHMGNSPEVRKVLQHYVKKRTPAILVSLGETQYVDTSGLATLVECAQNMRRYGGRLLVAGLNAQVADAFSLAQIEEFFSVFPTEADAVAELNRGKTDRREGALS